MNENKNKHEIDVIQLLEMLIKRWWIIVIAVLLCVGSAFAYTEFFVKPTYTSTTSIYIRGGGNLSIYQAILAGQYQADDYPEILGSYNTLEEAANNLNEWAVENGKEAKYTEAKVRSMIGYQIGENNIFKIKATGSDPDETKLVADEVSKVFKYRVEIITEANVAEMDVESARRGTLNSSGLKRNVLIGFALGFIAGVGIAVLLGTTNDVIYSDEWLLNKFKDEVPLLASIPDTNSAKNGKGYYKYKYYNYSRRNDTESRK